ncbi:MAG: hypothetical protein WD512_01710 [Candidatus Paceibacterota bacterium]
MKKKTKVNKPKKPITQPVQPTQVVWDNNIGSKLIKEVIVDLGGNGILIYESKK